jgi:hypothetical protein
VASPLGGATSAPFQLAKLRHGQSVARKGQCFSIGGIKPLATGQAAERTWIPEMPPKTAGRGHDSPIPPLATLPLHGDARGIADLDPDRARTGSIGAVHPL